MTALVVGAGGQVGRELVLRAPQGASVAAFDRAGLDVTDGAAVERAVAEHRPALVLNAAAYTAVDRAEEEPGRAFAVNRDGAAHLAAACARHGAALLHLSTDYVFDGTKAGPYGEDDPASPLGVYGRSKWEGEEAIRRALDRHVIVRVAWVFGPHGRNFVKTMARLAAGREELRVVADQRGGPTPAPAIADALWHIARQIGSGREGWGTFHFCGAPATTWHGLAEAAIDAARALGPVACERVLPIATADYPTPAARPANSVLACDRIRGSWGVAQPDWREHVAETVAVERG
jgi:dTDP-4-dehydrorhamnose reductase